jgi:hypothetical protein
MHEGLENPYQDALARHEARKCVCAQDSQDGRIARAGQFWNGKKDTRFGSEGEK